MKHSKVRGTLLGTISVLRDFEATIVLMTSLRRFCADDMFKFANVNLDHLTETVSVVYALSLNHCGRCCVTRAGKRVKRTTNLLRNVRV